MELREPRKTVKNLIGETFGKLTVVKLLGIDKFRKSVWKCKCECGNETEVNANSLRSGYTISCGCVQLVSNFKHGYARSSNGKPRPEYVAWQSMLRRCFCQEDANYKRYGGRGISVCEEWRQFKNFIRDMGERPTRKHSIERIDNDGNYEPGNCRWATKKEQDRNKRTNRIVEFNGLTMCITDWGAKTGMHPAAITWRIDNGWSVEDALTIPSGEKRK